VAEPEYLDLKAIADRLKMRQATVYQIRWRHRDKEPRWPAPDLVIGRKEAWRADRLDEIRAWLAARPAGGRPKGSGARTERE
jgi:hypothetical protein